MQVDWEPGPTEIVANWAPHLLTKLIADAILYFDLVHALLKKIAECFVPFLFVSMEPTYVTAVMATIMAVATGGRGYARI